MANKESQRDILFTKKQQEVNADIREKKPRHVILHGAVRSGKTHDGILYWLSIVKRTTGRLYIMTGRTVSSLKRNVLDEITDLTGQTCHLNINNEFTLYGNRIACFGSDKADSFKAMRGLTSSGWYANEVILSHQNSILEAFARCSEKGSRIIWETNPDKPSHYIKTDYIDKSGCKFEDGSYNILAYSFKLEDNDRLDKKYIEGLKQSIPKGTIYDRQILGLWKASETAIYSNYEIVQEPPARSDDVSYGMDFGFVDPTVLVKCHWVDQSVYVEGLFSESGLLPDDTIKEVAKHIIDKREPIYCDHKPDYIKALNDAGYNAMNADKDVEEGIRSVQGRKVYLVYNPLLIRQWENYENQKRASGEVLDYTPVKHEDHYPDAARYGIHSHKGNIGGVDSFFYEDCTKEFEV